MEYDLAANTLLTAQEVAAQTKLRTKYIYEVTKRGDLRGIPIGRYLRYRQSAVDEWLERCEQLPTHKPLDADPPADGMVPTQHSRIEAMRRG